MSKYKTIKDAYVKHGYEFFNKPLSINIFGVRANNSEPNSFDDLIGVAYVDNNGNEVCLTFQATTDAGIKVLGDKFGGVKGTLIMIAGQYFNMFKKGYHKGKYPALVQNIEIEVLRDTDKDNMLDFDSLTTDFGMFGLNLHHANENEAFPSTQVDNWSWGCQVIRKISDWRMFWSLITDSSEIYGDTFTYTLFNESYFDGGINTLK